MTACARVVSALATRSQVRRAVLATMVSLAACSETTNVAPEPPIVAPSNVQVPLDCRVDVSVPTMTCDPAPGASALLPSGMRASISIGGQNLYVALAAQAVIYDTAAGVLAASVNVRNLLSQALGSADGPTPDAAGVRVFFNSLPVVTSGTGTVTVRNPDGVGAFTRSDQPYFTYAEVVPGNGTSDPKTWQFNVPSTVKAFSFELLVNATLRDESTPLAQQPPHAFASGQFTGGFRTSCALRAGAGVYCWGDNLRGQFGLTSHPAENQPLSAVFAPPLRQIVSGTFHTCGLSSSGKAYCWGENGGGQLGDGTKILRTLPVPVAMPAGVTFVALDAGRGHTCGLSSTGKAYCWGRNGEGQIGDGTMAQPLTPSAVLMPEGVSFKSIAVAFDHTCAISSTGMPYCWGSNYSGELGDGTTISRPAPVEVRMPGNLAMLALEGGEDHTCGLSASRTVYCWGYNGHGQLGDGTTTTRSTPAPVTVPSGVSVADITSGESHTCLLSSSGTAYCWGADSSGQLGDGGLARRLTPIAATVPAGVSFASLYAGTYHTCGLTGGGAAYCWGNSARGSTPAPVTVAPGLSFTSLSGGTFQTCGLTSSGAAYCWGGEAYYLGIGKVTTNITTIPLLASGTERITNLATGFSGFHVCGLTSAGAAYCLGSGPQTPIAVSMPQGVAFRSLVVGRYYTCGLTSSGKAYCWGLNQWGMLGDGTTSDRAEPTVVTSSDVLAFTALSASEDHVCGVAASGKAYCWGSNWNGQLGDGTKIQRTTPTAVIMPAGVTFSTVVTGATHNCGLALSGIPYCWGDNFYGQLGDGTTITHLTPSAVNMPAGVAFTSVISGAYHTCGLTSSGAAYCWGQNADGSLGDGTATHRSVPTAVLMPPGVAFSSLGAGSSHTCGVAKTGIMYCWGANHGGTVGDGTLIQRNIPTRVLMP